MVKELWLIHHSHTDIGFTQPQQIVFELHNRFIDEALDLMDQTADLPDDARFRWTCESAGIVWRWWAQAGAKQRQRFLAAVQAGTLDVAAFRWNLTPLADHALFAQQLQEAGWLRAEGIPIRSAMQSDINGLPWGTVRLLLDHGIDGFSMAINEHFGRAVTPRPGAFWWASPDGHKLLTYNGPHYHSTPNRAMRLGGESSVHEAIPAVTAYLEKLHAYGYTLPVLGVQPTNIYFSDNDSPDIHLSGFVQRWNESGQPVRLRLCTLTQYFDRLRQESLESLPTLSGDWTDWWNFGAGSTARETRLHMQGQRDLQVARQLQGWSVSSGSSSERAAQLAQQASSALSLYAEHTWGADWGAATSSSDETAIQLSHKLNYAYEGATLARYLKRDALLNLARQLPGEGPSLLVYNANPFPVSAMLRVPESLERYTPDLPHLAQRFDVEWNGRRGQERWVGPLELPGLGHLSLPLERLNASSEGLSQTGHTIGNGQVTATFDPLAGGMTSLVCGGREYVRAGDRLGQVVLEWPTVGRRNAIFGPPQWEEFNMHAAWHHDWDAQREVASVVGNQGQTVPGAAEYEQQLQLANGETASVRYWLHPHERALHVRVTLNLEPDPTPRATYLHLPFALADTVRTHFETAGAAVEFDREQLPGSSRHYVTTLDWLRMQDAEAGVTVATPDAPLWQIGGYTFGQFDEEKAAPYHATLNAWMTNNYWDTNFMADQAGELRFEFTLELHAPESLADSAKRALQHIYKPEIQPYVAAKSSELISQLLNLDLDGVRLVGADFDETKRTLTLCLLNPTVERRSVRVASGHLKVREAALTTLAGQVMTITEPQTFELQIEERWWGYLVIDCL
ncbi:hypothetical protein [Deinococcus humi]|uniref:Glycoside hydrolase family 38 N-terminal domain-containing protein n=1 Tax=Deinococcus humi TaxID=662880 RepID=A0A7W8JWP3_9DEIO|nr:hypothetical protein [Deinococcus humi]MBB5364626.1 hypothetical protein [Deinococcus humi]GGO39112.1 hypothetical protein GCM10008949_46740 [Deinococcus humi]